MADKLVLSNHMKVGKQEILLDPTITINKCGKEVDPLLANDLMVKKQDGTFIPLFDFITQENISIESLVATVTGNSVRIDWIGETRVQFTFDDEVPVVHTANNGVWENFKVWDNVAPGIHTIKVKALRDRRGLEVECEVVQTITVVEDPHNIAIDYD